METRIAKTFRDELIAKHNMRVKITKRGANFGEICQVVDKKGHIYKVATSDGDKLFNDMKDFDVMPTPEQMAAKAKENAEQKAYEAEVVRIVKGPYDKKTMDTFEVHMSIMASLTREKLLQTGNRISEDTKHNGQRIAEDVLHGAHSSGCLQGSGPQYDVLCGQYATIIDMVKNYVAFKMNREAGL